MKAAVRWFIGNLPLMVMAVVLAALAWFVALEQTDPTVRRRFTQPIPVEPTGLPEDVVIVGDFKEMVQVNVRTTKSIWDPLKVDDFTATVDLTGLGPGVHDVEVQVDLGKEPSRILGVEPQTVSVPLDSLMSSTVPVYVEVEGEEALGYVKRPMVRDPEDVTVKGPTNYVTRVVEGFATISIEGADEDVQETLRLRPRDSEGDSVPFVTLVPDVAEVRVPIEPSDYYRPLAVRAVLTGEVDSGYRVTDISVDPSMITVFGTPDDLNALPGFIETKPIDVEGAQEDVTVRPGLNPPESVTVIPGQDVEVRVFVEALESSLTVQIVPEIQGLDPGYTVTVSPDTVQVILSGPLPKLEGLEPDDVRVTLDLFELPAGTHQIEPQVIVPEDIRAKSVNPATVQVKIALTPTATATSTRQSTITETTTTE